MAYTVSPMYRPSPSEPWVHVPSFYGSVVEEISFSDDEKDLIVPWIEGQFTFLKGITLDPVNRAFLITEREEPLD